MKMVTVTTTRTNAADTLLKGSVTPVDHPHIWLSPVTILADSITTVTAITKHLNAEVRTTETAHAFDIARHPKLQQHAQILADITISTSNNACTIRLLVRIIAKTPNATDTGTRNCCIKLALVLKVITPARAVYQSNMIMYVISTNPTTIAPIYRIWASVL